MTIDFGVYGDGDLYQSTNAGIDEYVTEYEAHLRRVGVVVRYTATQIPGATEAFFVSRIALRASPDRPTNYTHEAFCDRIEFTTRLSVVVKATGSEFQLYNVMLIAKGKRHQPKG